MELDFHAHPEVLSTLVDTMELGVFTVDAAGVFVAWSGGAERITGWTKGEVVGKPCTFLEGDDCKGFGTLHELLAKPPMVRDEGGVETPCVCSQECRVPSRQGGVLHLQGNVRVILDDHGAVAGAIGVFSDLSSFLWANQAAPVTEAGAGFEGMVGASQAMLDVFDRIQRAAESDVSVLITGETGTGKELAARAIHSRSARQGEAFVAVNCSALPDALLESELFGYEKGAFTGADESRPGLFETANGGTLFLDEIAEVSLAVQVKLLRVLEEREVLRVGGRQARPVDVRLVTAANRSLQRVVNSGEMREDFYYRIRVFEVEIPPLRERADDIPRLVDHLIRELSRARQRQVDGISREALDCLVQHDWPGNVRELKNAIEHAFVMVRGDRVTLLDLPTELRTRSRSGLSSAPSHHRSPARAEERQRVIDALEETGWKRVDAAERLGISRVTLWKKMKKLGIEE